MNVEHDAARHYTHGALERAVLEALLASGKDLETLAPSDLSSVDEFHLGWLAATIALTRRCGLADIVSFCQASALAIPLQTPFLTPPLSFMSG